MNEWIELLEALHYHEHIMAFLFGSTRITIMLSFVIFFGPSVTPAVRLPIALALYLPLHPILIQITPQFSWSHYGDVLFMLFIVAKEAFLGFGLAMLINLVFYVSLSAGVIIDNQRGASAAQESDPMTGEQSSPLGTVFMLSAINLFFTSGAFMAFLAIFYQSFAFWPIFEFTPGLLNINVGSFFATEVDYFVEKGFLLAAPFVLTALLCDIALGIMNRFAPQLNVFILSMPIKSAICSFIVVLYLTPFYTFMQELYPHIKEMFLNLNLLSH